MKYKNIIVLVNDINRINLDDFDFGLNQILVIEDNEINREKLKNLQVGKHWTNFSSLPIILKNVLARYIKYSKEDK